MAMKGYVVKRPFNVFTDDELEQVHGTMLDILERTGVKFEHDEALSVLHDAGCRVDREAQLVRFPPGRVEAALRKCPSRVFLRARNPEFDTVYGGNTVFFCPWIGMDTVDLDTWERRTPRVKDFEEAAQVLDYLDEVHQYGFGPWANTDPEVGEGPFLYVWMMDFNLRNAQKALYCASSMGLDEFVIQMHQAVGSRPAMLISGAPPLAWPGHQLNLVFSCSRADIPINPFSGVVSGASAPATLAGCVAQNYAEIAAIIVLQQTVKPGHEVLVGNYSQVMDMRSGSVVQGGPERGLLDAAWSQIWRRHNIPRTGLVGSDAKMIDYQCASEKTMESLLMAMAGSNAIYLHGGVYDELTNHPVAAILDNDVAKMVGRILGGIDVSHESLAADVVKSVGPIPGSFVGTKHTRETWKSEQLLPGTFDRLSYPEWVAAGKRGAFELAREQYEEIVKTHEVPPVSDDQDRELKKIVAAARKHLEGVPA
jgi:trimethylamine--corrinoid protein Co-methyltransferase